MSTTTLFFLVPIGMLAIVWSAYFVGCALQTGGIPATPGPPYSNVVTSTPDLFGLVAYWPLNDAQGSTTAKDIIGGHDGTYVSPPDYPNVPANSRPLNPPKLNLQQGSIVPGDVSNSQFTDVLQAASVDFEGGYVSIPWNTGMQQMPSLSQFTVEFWIKPGWSDAKFAATVFGAVTNTTGFAVFINEMNQLQVGIGNGTTLTVIPQNPTVAIDLTRPQTYIAVTGDSTTGTITLFANVGPDPGTLASVQSIPNTGYGEVGQTQQVTFFIGAGDSQDAPQNLRTPANPNGAPQFPFQGLIQSVALYNQVLDTSTLEDHFNAGVISL